MSKIENNETSGIKIESEVICRFGYFDYLVEDASGLYGVCWALSDPDVNPACTYLLERDEVYPDNIKRARVVSRTDSTENWPVFYRLGWTKPELHAGLRSSWGLVYKDED